MKSKAATVSNRIPSADFKRGVIQSNAQIVSPLGVLRRGNRNEEAHTRDKKEHSHRYYSDGNHPYFAFLKKAPQEAPAFQSFSNWNPSARVNGEYDKMERKKTHISSAV